MADRRRAVLAMAVAAALAGCAAVPTGGAVHLGRALPQSRGLGDLDVRVLPPSWQVGLGPQQVVNGFLRALVNDDDDYAVARSYLTPAASASWRPGTGTTTYDESRVTQSQVSGAVASRTTTIQLTAPRVGRIDQHGSYLPADGTLTASFTVARQNSNAWRIDRLPNGVLISAADAQRTFHVADVYWFNRQGTWLVPEQILLQSVQRGIATALVAALLGGPGEWLAPAVHTALPRGTSLLGNVPVHDNGVADVNLSAAVRLAPGADLVALSAQIVWTLRQVSGVTAVRLLAEGAPLPVPGAPIRQPVTSWSQFDPDPSPSGDVLYVRDGHLAETGGDISALRRSDPGSVESVGRSRVGDQLAVVQRTQTGRVRLLTGRLGSRLRVRLTADAMTAPTFTSAGDPVVVATTAGISEAVAVAASGARRHLSADPGAIGGQPRALRVSPDGARVALVTAGGSLLVGRVSGAVGAEELSSFRAIVPALRDVRGVAWVDAGTLALTAAGSGTARQVVETDTVGYAPHPVALEGLRGEPVDVTGAPGQPLLVATDAGLIWSDVAGWRAVGPGRAPVHTS